MPHWVEDNGVNMCVVYHLHNAKKGIFFLLILYKICCIACNTSANVMYVASKWEV